MSTNNDAGAPTMPPITTAIISETQTLARCMERAALDWRLD